MANLVSQLQPIFEPKTVAVIGASQDTTKFGGRAFLRPLETGYRGALYPVNPLRKEIWGVKAYPSISDIPDEIDLAVISIPAAQVPQAMEECIAKGVKGVVILSSGFAEVGDAALQKRVTEIAHQAGIRFVGPNSMGLWSASVKLNLMFETCPRPGPISFISQSGTLGRYLFEVAQTKGYGFSRFVSSGNQASLNVCDYLEYLAQDETTKAIVLYIEGIDEGQRFMELAREVVKKKPVIVYKAGRTEPGRRAALSHTASLAGSDRIFDAVCQQAGIIRCLECFHPFDMAQAIAHQPLPQGKRVVIIGSGGQCVTTADACASLGLELPQLDPDTQQRILKVLPDYAPPPMNPIDTAAPRDPETIARILEILAPLEYIDGIITHAPYGRFGAAPSPELVRHILADTEAILEVPRTYHKPIIVTARAQLTADTAMDILQGAGIPLYSTPEETARAMYSLMKYAETRQEMNSQ